MNDSLRDFDARHLWHPYTSLGNMPRSQLVVGAKRCTLKLDDGSELIDAMASWWAAIHGYNHPELNQAVHSQLDDFAHVMFGGLTHRPAIELGQALMEMTGRRYQAAFYADSGSVAVEVALKMALQYWQGKEKPEKNRIMTLRAGYHGDTFATMSLADPDDGMHRRFRELLHEPIYLPKPPTGYSTEIPRRYIDELDAIFARCAKSTAALVIEPVVQNAGGMNIYNPEIVTCLRQLCDTYDVLLILDEIATGFGRTGRLFGFEHAGVAADILCLGKALTAGYLSFAVTLATKEVAEGVAGRDQTPLMHGPTYMGNALAAAVALKNMHILARGDWRASVTAIEQQLKAELAVCRRLPGVVDVRVLGAIGVVEVDRPVDLEKATQAAIANGVWLRPFRNLIYCMPPYIMTADELSRVTHAIANMIKRAAY